MKHIQLFEEFINESNNQKYDIARLVNGNIKELITGNLRELTYRFSKAIDDATEFNNKLSDDPKTVEEFLELINLAQKLKDKFKGNTEYKLWDKKKGEPIKESDEFINEATSIKPEILVKLYNELSKAKNKKSLSWGFDKNEEYPHIIHFENGLKSESDRHEGEMEEFSFYLNDDGKTILGIYELNGYDEELKTVKDAIDWCRANKK